MRKRKCLYVGYFFAFFSDGTMGHNDGVGYIGETSKEEVKELYLALKKYFENKE